MIINQLLRKRLASSPAAFASTLERHISTLNGHTKGNQASRNLDDRILRRAIARAGEDYADDNQRESAEVEAIAEASKRLHPLTPEERKLLNGLSTLAQQMSRRADSKARTVIDWLKTHLKSEGQWTNARVILFTEYRTTQQWLQEILSSHGFGADRLELIYGGMDPKDRETVKAAFQANPQDSPVRILLATDAASEGIDLQNHCHMLIHLEIPYNPNVMEQRNGRIDRHGQKASEVVVWHPVDPENGHGEDIMRALRKLDAMRADMGSVNPVIAPQFPDLLEGRLRVLDTQLAQERINRSRRFIKVERDLRDRIAKLHERLLETKRDQHFDPGHIEKSVRTALNLADKPDLISTTLSGVSHGKVFYMPPLSGSWSRCLEGIEHPYTKKIRPITFDHDTARGRDDVVLVHLNHPLVQMSLRLLRAEVWARDDVKKLHRVTVLASHDNRLESPVVVVVSRLVITGGNHHRLHEELTEAGGYLRDTGFRREDRVTEVRRLLEESTQTKTSASLLDTLRFRFEKHCDAILTAVDTRSKDRLRHLANTIETHKQKEIKDIRQVLDDLDRSLRAELTKDAQPKWLSLFTEDERTQLKIDRGVLKARLQRIPAEKEQEIHSIETRHSGLLDRTFPVAVFFIVPASLAKENQE